MASNANDTEDAKIRNATDGVLLNNTPTQHGWDISTKLCSKHKQKELDFYCNDDDELVCSSCKIVSHANCKDIVYIPDVSKDNEIGAFGLKISDLTKTAKEAIETRQMKIKKTETFHSDADKTFQEIRKDVTSALDKAEHNVLNESRNTLDQDKEKLQVEEAYLEEIGNLDTQFKRLQQNRDIAQLFLLKKKSKNNIAIIEARLASLKILSRDVPECKIKVSDNRQDILNQLEGIAKLTCTGSDSCSSLRARSVSEIESVQTWKHGSKPTTSIQRRSVLKHLSIAKRKDNMFVKNIFEWTPSITGSVCLPGKRIVIVDNRNKKIKAIDIHTGKRLADLTVKEDMSDVTCLNETQVAVTCPNEKKIVFVNVLDNKLTLDHVVNVNGLCRNIAGLNGKLVVTCDDQANVDILDSSGKKLRTLVKLETSKGFDDLQLARFFVAVSQDELTVYLSDRFEHTVRSYDINGEVQAVFESEMIKNICGLVVDRYDRVLLCCIDSIIIVLSPELNWMDILYLGQGGVHKPKTVSYCGETNKLFFGKLFKETLLVYELQNT